VEIIAYRKELKELVQNLKNAGKSIGLIPTMGALHEGHMSLVKEAKKSCDVVICSIFVNPTQFDNPEDLEKYPKMPEKDTTLLANNGCDIVFSPSVAEVYTKEIPDVEIDLGKFATVFEGAYRSGHFDGVLMVVHRLFSIVQPNKSYFGLKDFQQVLVVKELARQAHPEVKIVACAIEREEDGLAMSSRNLRLNEEERSLAPQLNFALRSVVRGVNAVPLMECLALAKKHIEANTMNIDYLAVANAENLQVISSWDEAQEYIILAAAHLGPVRLIDNMVF
jgi:pantoate--beta-alanine ligase